MRARRRLSSAARARARRLRTERPSDEPIAADTTAEGEDPLGAFEEEELTGRLSVDGSAPSRR